MAKESNVQILSRKYEELVATLKGEELSLGLYNFTKTFLDENSSKLTGEEKGEILKQYIKVWYLNKCKLHINSTPYNKIYLTIYRHPEFPMIVGFNLENAVITDAESFKFLTILSTNFKGAKFSGCVIKHCKFEKCDLSNATTLNCDIDHTDFIKCDLQNAQFTSVIRFKPFLSFNDMRGTVINPKCADDLLRLPNKPNIIDSSTLGLSNDQLNAASNAEFRTIPYFINVSEPEMLVQWNKAISNDTEMLDPIDLLNQNIRMTEPHGALISKVTRINPILEALEAQFSSLVVKLKGEELSLGLYNITKTFLEENKYKLKGEEKLEVLLQYITVWEKNNCQLHISQTPFGEAFQELIYKPQHPMVAGFDVSKVVIKNRTFNNLQFLCVNLEGATFHNVALLYIHFENCNLSKIKSTNINIKFAQAIKCDLRGSEFEFAENLNLYLAFNDMRGTKFSEKHIKQLMLTPNKPNIINYNTINLSGICKSILSPNTFPPLFNVENATQMHYWTKLLNTRTPITDPIQLLTETMEHMRFQGDRISESIPLKALIIARFVELISEQSNRNFGDRLYEETKGFLDKHHDKLTGREKGEIFARYLDLWKTLKCRLDIAFTNYSDQYAFPSYDTASPMIAGLNLENALIENLELSAKFLCINFKGAHFHNCTLTDSHFVNCDLSNSVMLYETNLNSTTFNGCNMQNLNWESVSLFKNVFIDNDLSGAHIEESEKKQIIFEPIAKSTPNLRTTEQAYATIQEKREKYATFISFVDAIENGKANAHEIQTFVESGININFRFNFNGYRTNALEVALQCSQNEIADTLRKYGAQAIHTKSESYAWLLHAKYDEILSKLKGQALTDALYENTKQYFDAYQNKFTGEEKGELLKKYCEIWEQNKCVLHINDTQYQDSYHASLSCIFSHKFNPSAPMISGFNLRNAVIYNLNIMFLCCIAVNFEGARLISDCCNGFVESSFYDCNFSGMITNEFNLSKATFIKCNLQKALMKNVYLSEARFLFSDVRGAQIDPCYGHAIYFGIHYPSLINDKTTGLRDWKYADSRNCKTELPAVIDGENKEMLSSWGTRLGVDPSITDPITLLKLCISKKEPQINTKFVPGRNVAESRAKNKFFESFITKVTLGTAHPSEVACLIQFGININNHPVLEMAIENRMESMAEELIKNGAIVKSYTLIPDMVRANYLKGVQLAIAGRCPIDTYRSEQALQDERNYEIIKLLLNAEEKAGKLFEEQHFYHILSRVFSDNSLAAQGFMPFLIAKIPDVNAPFYHTTYLHIAVDYKNPTAVSLLLQRGADLHALNDNRKTPLQKKTSPEVSQLLIDAEAAQKRGDISIQMGD